MELMDWVEEFIKGWEWFADEERGGLANAATDEGPRGDE